MSPRPRDTLPPRPLALLVALTLAWRAKLALDGLVPTRFSTFGETPRWTDYAALARVVGPLATVLVPPRGVAVPAKAKA